MILNLGQEAVRDQVAERERLKREEKERVKREEEAEHYRIDAEKRGLADEVRNSVYLLTFLVLIIIIKLLKVQKFYSEIYFYRLRPLYDSIHEDGKQFPKHLLISCCL